MSMRRVALWAVAGVGAAAIVATVVPGPGNLVVNNESDADVRVTVGRQHVTVAAGGGVEVLGAGCVSDVVVERPGSDPVTLAGQVCPEDSILVTGDRVILREGLERS